MPRRAVARLGDARSAATWRDIREAAECAFDDAKSNWSLLEMTEYDQQGQPVETKLADDEELK